MTTALIPEPTTKGSEGRGCRPVRTYEVDLRRRGQVANLLKEVRAIRQGRRRGGHWSMSVTPTEERFAARGGRVSDAARRPLDIDNSVLETVVRQVQAHREMGGRVILGTDGAVCAACHDTVVAWHEVPTRGLQPVQPWAARQRRSAAR